MVAGNGQISMTHLQGADSPALSVLVSWKVLNGPVPFTFTAATCTL